MKCMIRKSYKNICAWQVGMEIVKYIYQVTQNFPPKENFGLTSQMRRAAVSIPSNIAKAFEKELRMNLNTIYVFRMALFQSSRLKMRLLLVSIIFQMNNSVKSKTISTTFPLCSTVSFIHPLYLKHNLLSSPSSSSSYSSYSS